MKDRDSILVMGVACEKANQRSAAKKIYKRYIMTSEYYNDYKKVIGESKLNNEVESLHKIDDVIKFDKHIKKVCLLCKAIAVVKAEYNFSFKNASNVAYLHEYLISTNDHSKDIIMLEKYLLV